MIKDEEFLIQPSNCLLNKEMELIKDNMKLSFNAPIDLFDWTMRKFTTKKEKKTSNMPKADVWDPSM